MSKPIITKRKTKKGNVLVIRWFENGTMKETTTSLPDTPSNRHRAQQIARLITGGSTDGNWKSFVKRLEKNFYPTVSKSYRDILGTVLRSMNEYRRPIMVSDVDASYIRGWTDWLTCCVNSKQTYVRHLKAALSYAVDCEYIESVPHFRMRQKGEHPLRETTLNHDDYLAIRARAGSPSSEWLIDCLWYSGLRIGELHRLTWDDESDFGIRDLTTSKPVFVIRKQKNGRRQLHPITPDFAKILIPKAKPTGRVLGKRAYSTLVKEVIRMGKGVSVGGKYASAHDFRAAFATRWSEKLSPQKLMQLMRHRHISTTMKYYVRQDVEDLRNSLEEEG